MLSCKEMQAEKCHIHRTLFSPVRNEMISVSLLYLDELSEVC